MRRVARKPFTTRSAFAALCLTLGLAPVVAAPGAGASPVGPVTLFSSTTTGTTTVPVPAGVTSVTVTAVGGSGGAALNNCAVNTAYCAGGRGAVVTTTAAVAPGDSLTIVVAANGTPGAGGNSAAATGLGGSGAGAGGDSYRSGQGGYGGGGGGGSAVFDAATAVAVAGGGGGTAEGVGGDAGQPGGNGEFGGGAGTQTGPGAAGNCVSAAPGDGTNGGLGSGGGGGGYFGGGGACNGGGGGGSSYPAADMSGFDATATPSVTITYEQPAVACLPGYSSATGNAPCTEAPAGYYVDSPSAMSATACAPGSYQPDSAQTSCILAAKGYYVDTAAAIAQTACPSGTTSIVTGATACVLVNQAPTFTKGPDQIVSANAAAQTVSPWATAISPGPPNESGQRLDFTVTNDNNALFSAQPSVDVDGTLHFTPAANQTGFANVSVYLRDDGGVAAGGVDTSATQQFTITVNQAPSFAPGTSPQLTASVGQPYGYPFVATGYPTTITYSLVGAPSWLTIDANGVVGGTPPTGTKTFTYSVQATNSAGNVTAGPYTVTVTSPPPASTKADVSVALSCPASAKINVSTACTLTVRNAGPAVAKNVWVALALPSSLTRVSNTGNAIWWRNIVTWQVGSLNANASVTYTVTVKAKAAGRAIIGAATASIGSPDPSWKNNFAAGTTTFTK